MLNLNVESAENMMLICYHFFRNDGRGISNYGGICAKKNDGPNMV